VSRRQRDAQWRPGFRCNQHHHRLRAAALAEILGVTAERDAGVVDHALLHRPGDQGVGAAGKTQFGRAIERFDHVGGIGGIEAAGLRRRPQRHRQHGDFAGGRCAAAARIEVTQYQRHPQLPRTRAQQDGIADDDALYRSGILCQCAGEVGADAGRFARRDQDARNVHTAAIRCRVPRPARRR
jgi:hypothetical protein